MIILWIICQKDTDDDDAILNCNYGRKVSLLNNNLTFYLSYSSNGSSGMKKPRLPRNTDKAERKKEQNKTAATRYREKKKLQAAIISVQEDELEKVNDQLTAQRDDLQRQVRMCKELLRAVMTDRKVKKEAGVIAWNGASRRIVKWIYCIKQKEGS